MAEAPWLLEPVLERVAWILRSHQAAFGRPLIAAARRLPASAEGWRTLAQELFAADRVVLAHDGASAEGDPGPRLIYANRAALTLWGRTWGEMVGLPSRLTAEPGERAGRAAALRQALQQEAIAHYSGVRIDRHGRRFLIRGARLWSLRDGAGNRCGQAASFSDWTRLAVPPDGAEVRRMHQGSGGPA
ncbi:MAG: MEKHLA domain-containing protein [Synechococcus sp.]